MSKQIIGIAANQLPAGSADFLGNPITYTPQGFVTATEQVGGLPLLLPISTPESAVAYINQIDKLLLAGGQDVDPQFYGEDPHPKLGATNLERDLFERALITEALNQQKPIFAVCRGMQLLNVTLGGNLYQDLSLYSEWNVRHVQHPTPPHFATHEIEVLPDSLLSQLVGQQYRVNSYHHQGIKRLGKNLKVEVVGYEDVATWEVSKEDLGILVSSPVAIEDTEVVMFVNVGDEVTVTLYDVDGEIIAEELVVVE